MSFDHCIASVLSHLAHSVLPLIKVGTTTPVFGHILCVPSYSSLMSKITLRNVQAGLKLQRFYCTTYLTEVISRWSILSTPQPNNVVFFWCEEILIFNLDLTCVREWRHRLVLLFTICLWINYGLLSQFVFCILYKAVLKTYFLSKFDYLQYCTRFENYKCYFLICKSGSVKEWHEE